MSTKKTIDNQTPDTFVGAPAGQPRQLPNGYVGQNVPTDFSIPSCGIEDVDKALFALFDKSIGFMIEAKNKVSSVPVIMAIGERFALVKRRQPIKDKQGALILPLISIRRTGLEQTKWSLPLDIGDMIIKKRLDASDRSYQSIINKLQLKHQSNVSSTEHFLDLSNRTVAQPGTFASRRVNAGRATDSGLGSDIGTNIFEFITIPFPQFFIAKYEIVFWTQYTQHMNTMLETLMASYHAQGEQFRISSDKGYWFVAYVDADMSPADNFEEMSDSERIVKYTFNVTVPAYIVAGTRPGQMSPFRRYLSAPQISFGLEDTNGQVFIKTPNPSAANDLDKFILDDVNVLGKDGESVISQRESIPYTLKTVLDPFSGKQTSRRVRVTFRNVRSGETAGNLSLEDTFDDI